MASPRTTTTGKLTTSTARDSLGGHGGGGSPSPPYDPDHPNEPGQPEQPPFVVHGTVQNVDGSAVPDVVVKAVDVDIRNEERLGVAKTAKDGTYNIRYSRDQFEKQELGTADLKIYVYRTSEKETPLATSKTFYNVAQDFTLDVVVGGSEVKGPSEFAALSKKIIPLLGGLSPTDIVEDDKHQDVSFLVGETGEDEVKIRFFATASQHHAKTKVQTDVFYGLFRESISTDLQTLLHEDVAALTKALTTAVASNIINPLSTREITPIVSQLHSLGVQSAIKAPSGLTPLGSILGSVTEKPGLFLDTFSKHDGLIEDFWKEIDANPEFEGKTADLQFSVQLGVAALSHPPLVTELQSQQKAGKISSFSDLAKFSLKDWMAIIQKPGIGAPDMIPGDTPAKKAQNYAQGVSRLMEDTFPTQFISSRLNDADDDKTHGTLSGKKDISTFFTKNPDFTFTTTRLPSLLKSNPTALDGIHDTEGFKSNLAAMQRVYRIAPQYSQMRTLVAGGVNSSMQVARMGLTSFTAKFGTAMGGPGEAARIFEQASQSHAMSYHLLADFGNPGSFVPIGKWTDWGAILGQLQETETGIPDWTTLFGSMDICSCTECRSVDGPAAYLVDILHFLKDRLLVDWVVRDAKGTITTVIYKKRFLPGTDTTVDKSAKDVLFERRPDIADIELTCQNTNTPLPYIDLVNEALENAVSPPKRFQPIPLPDDAWLKLNDAKLDGVRDLFDPPLTIYAMLTIMKPGEWWTVDELGYTFTILRAAGKVTVTARSLQTKGTAKERAANSQYVNIEAYNIVRTQVYPWSLPFDVWTESVRTYLVHVAVGRYELMEVFFSPDRATVLNETAIVHEFLALTPFDAKLVTGDVTQQDGAPSPGPWNLWGIAAEDLSPGVTIPDPVNQSTPISSGNWVDVVAGRVDVFLQQSGLTFPQLLNIVEISNVFGSETSLDIRPQENQPPDTCDPSKLLITGVRADVLAAIVQCFRLLRKLDGWSIIDLGKVFAAVGFPSSPANMEALLAKISHIQRLTRALDLPLEFVLVFWSQISIVPYTDHESDDEEAQAESLYAQIFRNETISTKPDEVFTKDPRDLSGTLSGNSAPITAALSISPVDLAFLLADLTIVADSLSLDNLSKLFRHTVLAKALVVSIPDYVTLLKLVSANPFASTAETVLFVERVQNTPLSGFSWAELDYLLRHSFTVDSGISPTDDALALVLDDIRSGLRTIATENTYDTDTVDTSGDLTKKKLALLSWDPSIISQAVGILNNTASFTVPLATAPPSTVVFPSDIQDKISYDATSARLTYSRAMTVTERDLLKGLPGAPADFVKAIDDLFNAPRTFFKRNMRTFSIPNYSVDLATFPTTIKIPMSLRKKVYFDPSLAKLHSVGAITEAERQVLLDLSTDPTTDSTYLKAVGDLYDGPNSLTPALGDEFVTPADVTRWFDSATNTNGDVITPSMRFAILIQKLLPYLREKLSNQLIRQKIGQTINMDSQVVENLLMSWLTYASNPINQVFRSEAYAQSSQKSPISRTSFSDQFQVLMLLTKVGMVINKFKLSALQLNWVFTYRKRSGDPTAAWLDLNALPLSKVGSGTQMFASWERLYAVTRLRDALVGGEKLLDSIFSAARVTPVATDTIVPLLAKDMKVQESDLTFLVGPQGLNLLLPGAYQDEIDMTRIIRAMKLFREIGCTPADGQLVSKSVVEEQQARAVKQALKSKYGQSTWDTIAPRLSNILRDAQRASLVAYLLAHPNPDASPSWRTANDLYAYFLMDVEMGPCQKTSRIKQAISSVQLFAQRCLMNLETEVQANEEVDSFWKEWTWMKSFRIAGANHQVFEKPENFLDSSVRDDKTQFFTELESEIQQADITQDTAETAVLNYLEKLDQVARLEVVSFFHQQESDGRGQKAVDVMHVFSRTRGKPQRYFYCKRVNGTYWTSWEKLDVDIQGDHLIPVMWKRRLYLFWAVFTEKQKRVPITLPSGNNPLPDGDSFWEVKLAWTERKQSKWLPKVLSDASLIVPKSNSAFDEQDMKELPGRTLITFKAQPNTDTGELRIRALGPYPLGQFYFNGIRGQPVAQLTDIPLSGSGLEDAIVQAIEGVVEMILYNVNPVSQTRVENMGFGETTPSDDALWVRTDQSEKVQLLGKTPGGKFHLAIAHQDRIFQSQRPFWFQHDQKCFFIEPEDVQFIPIVWLPRPVLINPVLLNGSLASQYWNIPIPVVDPPYLPHPDIAGPLSFSHTFEYASDMNVTLKNPPKSVPSLLAAKTLTVNAPALRNLQVNFPPARAQDLIGDVGAVRRIDLTTLRFPSLTMPFTYKEFRFSTFYHPFISELIRVLNRDGLDGLYQRPLQQAKNNTFATDYSPIPLTNAPAEYPAELIDFDDNMYAVYNWELFFHVPVLIAERLSKNQKFEEAQKWFHYVFDPTDTSGLAVPQRYWRTKKLFEVSAADYVNQTIKNIFDFLAQGGDPAKRAGLSADQLKYLNLLEQNVARWRADPFKPFMVARARVTAFQKSVVMKYLDNLIAWGDSLFRGFTIELINEATQIYILAADILGKRPVEMASRAIAMVQTYGSLEPKLDAYSNALVAIEEFVPPRQLGRIIINPGLFPLATSPGITYFCVPKNDKLLSYWDTVSDRLFKIRHCMNLKGIVQELPLFEPPIDPAMLIRAVASGVDLSSAIGDINAPLPHHRYVYLAGKATELCQELKALGNAILANLEKKDAGQMALLNSTQGMNLLDAVRLVKVQQVQDTLWVIDALNKSNGVLMEKWNFYQNIDFMNAWEITHMAMEGAAMVLSLLDSGSQPVAAVLHLIPDAKLGAPTSIGVTIGGANVGKSSSKFAKFIEKTGVLLSRGSSMAATMGGYWRRKDEWDLQFRIADNELKQLASQLESAKVKNAMAEKELDNHDIQVKNAKETDDFMKSKYTNVELYDWMLSQLSTTYFQTYQMVFDAAKRAERAFSFELAVDQPDFISFDYWDSMRKGLCAGERLFYDLKRMDMAYMDQDIREYEITRSISLAQLDPVALIQLRQGGACFFNIPEAIFDIDYPGHYMRRIKAVTVTIPCVAGPYTSISSTLSLIRSSVRTQSTLSNGKYARRDNDVRFTDNYGQFQSIVTSSGINDAGLFETNLRDERYLPFERAGVISSWKMELPTAFKQYDYDTISDVIVTIRYTSREGGSLLGAQAAAELKQKALDSIALAESQNGLARLFDMSMEFPDLWYKFLKGTSSTAADGSTVVKQEATLPLTAIRFPYLFSSASITITKVDLFVRIKPPFLNTHTADSLTFTLSDSATTPGDPLAMSAWSSGADEAARGKVFRATKAFEKPVGSYYLSGSLNAGAAMIDMDAVAQFYLVCHYRVKWS